MKILFLMISFFFSNISLAAFNTEGIQTYQKNVHLLPEHKQKLVEDIKRYHNADNLWDVLREQFSLPHYEESYAVQTKIEWYMNNQEFLLRAASRAAPYLYYISQQVRSRHLPAELVLLPIVESGYNPFSVSNMGASGIWQLMPDTASGLGVKRDWWYDGRRDVIASTHAALNYLAYLQSFFEGNWLLAIAAYNTGEGNVLAAIKRNIRAGRDTDFWSLPVAQETRDYVPSLLALAVIISRPDKYPVYFPPIRSAPYLAQVDVGSRINLKYAAMLAGMSNQKLLQLNPGFNRPSIAMGGTHKLILPIENVEQFTENLARSPLNRQIKWVHYKVKSGDTLLSIAKKFNTTTADIHKMNHLSKFAVQKGTNLLIPHIGELPLEEVEDSVFPMQETLAANEIKPASKVTDKNKPFVTFVSTKNNKKSAYTLQPGDTIYVIRAKDTLASIAKRYHLSAQALKAANKSKHFVFKLGKQIVIPTHEKILTQKTNKNSTATDLKSGDTIYMVRRGDTLEKIARKFKVTASMLRLTNVIDNGSLSEGQSLIIPTHLRG